MAFLPASAINGSALPAEMIRLASYAATAGTTGVILPTDLLVRGLGVGGVSIDPGSAAIASRFLLAAKAQSYMVSNDAANGDAVLAVPAAGSGGPRVDYVIIRIDDPQYAGSGSPKGCTAVLVPSITALAYPFVALARLTQPAGNSAGIQPSMVADLRAITTPLTKDVWRPKASTVATTETLVQTGSDGEWFPNAGGEQLVDIPWWATRVQIEAEWLMVRIPAGSNAFGRCWVEFGPYLRPSTREQRTQDFQFDTAAVANVDRRIWKCVDDKYVPASYRGTTQTFIMKARNDVSVTSGARPQLDALSGTSMKLRFLNVPDSSTS